MSKMIAFLLEDCKHIYISNDEIIITNAWPNGTVVKDSIYGRKFIVSNSELMVDVNAALLPMRTLNSLYTREVVNDMEAVIFIDFEEVEK